MACGVRDLQNLILSVFLSCAIFKVNFESAQKYGHYNTSCILRIVVVKVEIVEDHWHGVVERW